MPAGLSYAFRQCWKQPEETDLDPDLPEGRTYDGQYGWVRVWTPFDSRGATPTVADVEDMEVIPISGWMAPPWIDAVLPVWRLTS